jgi:predicted RNA binding protein YcfA (HicA-like mRNA interferase family)
LCHYRHKSFKINKERRTLLKSSELHKLIKTAGWKEARQRGSHIIYEKEGQQPISVPFHGSKEIPTGIALKLKKIAGI